MNPTLLKIASIECIVFIILLFATILMYFNQKPASDARSEYIESIRQASYDMVTNIPETRIDNGLLLKVTTQNINENQKQVLIKVSNAPDSGRLPLFAEATLIKIR